MKIFKPKYERMAEHIARRIDSGELAHNSFLEGERILAENFGISRVTVRAGLELLVKKRYLEPMAGKGYRVFEIPKEPSAKSMMNIGGLWCSGESGEHTFRLFTAAGETAEKNNGVLFLCNAGDSEPDQAVKLSAMLEKHTDGLLVVPTYSEASGHMTLGNHRLLKAVYDSGKPLVLLDRPFPERDLPCAVNDDAAGGRMTAEWFASRGHSKILMLAIDTEYYITRLRFGAFRETCGRRGIELNELRLPVTGMSPASAYAHYLAVRGAIAELVRKEKITGVYLNIGVISGKIIEDLERFDLEFAVYDLENLHFVRRPTVLVRRPIEKIAQCAAEMLIAEIAGKRDAVPGQVRFIPELIEPPLLNSNCSEFP